MLVIVYAAIASLAASAAASSLRAERSRRLPVWIGTLAGLFAAILMAMLMITYHTKPGETPTALAALARGEGGSTLRPASSIRARSSAASLLAAVSSLSP